MNNQHNYETFRWEAAHTEGRMMTHHWPLESPEAVIALVHGQGEHGGRYHHVAHFMRKHDYATLAVDLTGHGVSAGKRGHVKNYDCYLKDTEQLIAQCAERYPDTPIYLYGHSMGGNIVANFALSEQYQNLFQKLIITSPWFRLAFEPPMAKVLMGKLVRGLYPSYTELSELDAQSLSHDPVVNRRYEEDELVHDSISVSAFFGVMEAGRYALDHASGLSHPTLLMHGTGDKVTSCQASEEFSEQASQSMIHFKAWDGLFHELHNEIEWKEVLQYVADWLE